MPAQPPRDEEQHARELRRLLELGETEPIADIVEVAQRAGVDCFLTSLPSPIAGLAGRVNGRWYIVAGSGVSSAGRIRFTLAHELGHVFMGHEPSVDDAETLGAWGGSLPLEVQANFFAAEFLMPRHAVEDRAARRPIPDALDALVRWIEEFAGDYGVTSWVPLYRLRTLDLIDWADEQAIGSRLSHERPVDSRRDTVAAMAGTGQTWMPVAYQRRAKVLEAGDENNEDDSPW